MEDEPGQYETLNSSEFSSTAASVNPQLKIESIQFTGIKRTDPEFLMKTIALTGVEGSADLMELSKALNKAFERLERLNIFKDVSVTIDQASDEPPGNDENPVHAVKIVFKCKEKKFNIRTGTELQRKDIAWNFGGQFFNLFGKAESLEVNSSIGANSSMPFNLNFLKPINGDPDRKFFINSAIFKENFLNYCKWRQEVQSFSTGLQLQKGEEAGRHEFKYLIELRRLFDVQSGASHVIRDQAGRSMKSSLVHTWNLSTRDSPVFQTRGHLVKISNELAGIGGYARFFKSEITLQNNWSKSIFTLTKTLKLGFALPFGETASVPFFDRFQMGGPTSIRGFPVNSLGPKQFTDSIGGTSSIETGLQLSFPIIKSAANFSRAHLFINAGLLTDNSYATNLNSNVSVGGGIMFKMAESARLELNFSAPIIVQKGVESNRGLQVGIGMEFL